MNAKRREFFDPELRGWARMLEQPDDMMEVRQSTMASLAAELLELRNLTADDHYSLFDRKNQERA